MYTVAICIPSYNNVNTMRRLMDSITIQTFRDFVVIITDDSNNREIEELVFEYKDVAVVYHKNEIRLGLSANTNMAIEMAQKYEPKYIKIMYHDDFFSFQDSLFKMVSLLENDSQSDIAFCGTYQVSDRDRHARAITEEQLMQLKNDFRILFKGNYIGAPSATIVRNIGIYMDINLVWEVDVEWYLRILAHNSKFAWSTEPLISVTISNTQMTNYCKSNKELMLEFEASLEDEDFGYVAELVHNSGEILNATLDMNGDAVAAYLHNIHNSELPILKYNDENSLSCVVTLAYLSARNCYRIEREEKSGKGYADFIFYPRRKNLPGIVLELKADSTPLDAVRQIKEREYCEKLKKEQRIEREKKEAENEAKEKINAIITELKNTNKEDVKAAFASLARENSNDESTKDNGGSLGFINKNTLSSSYDELVSAAYNLKDGEYSTSVITTELGYHVILREETKEKAYQMAIAGGKCTDRLNRRNGTYHNRQAIRLNATVGESPPPTKNIA